MSSYGFLIPSILRLSISARRARTKFESDSSDFSDSRKVRKRTAHAESAVEARSERTAAIGATGCGDVELEGCETHDDPASANTGIQTRRITAPLAEVMVSRYDRQRGSANPSVFRAHALRVLAAPRCNCVVAFRACDNGQPQKLRLTIELQHGAYRDRTDDLLVANQALSQLS
jgi:hypothetical protein